MTARYLVALLDPPSSLKFKYPCKNGEEIVRAAKLICEAIQWNPEEHYDDFYETLADPSPLDDGQVAFIDLWGSNLIASMVIGTPEEVVKAALEFGKLVEQGN